MNPQEAGNYIADVINKNRQLGETNNQVLSRLFNELLSAVSILSTWTNEANRSDCRKLSEKFNVKDLYNDKSS